jgi:hypothetical protein
MFNWIDAGVLAGMSMAMAFWLLADTIAMGILTWRYRDRFSFWGQLGSRDRADAILNISLFIFFAHATFQRLIATYSFAAQEWRLSPLTVATAPGNLLLACASVAGLMWWVCFYLFGPARHHYWWMLLAVSGIVLGGGVAWRY